MEGNFIGYEDERFPHPVGQSLHCSICTNVIRDPVMCPENEHLFCRTCITRYLTDYQRCPTCMEPLTVDTLKQASRGVRNMLSELEIRCEFFNRGCGECMPLEDLERHVRDCGYAPAVCSNEGCKVEVNKQDLVHHETATCDLRRVHCHSCDERRQETNDNLNDNLAAMDVKFDRTEKDVERMAEKLERKVEGIAQNLAEAKLEIINTVVEIVNTIVENVAVKVELVQGQLHQQEETNRQSQAANEEMARNLNEITRQLKRMIRQSSHEVHAEQEGMKKGNAEADEMDREPNVVVAGGENVYGSLNSVEMFCLSSGTWTPLQPMKKSRDSSSSVVYNNQMLLLGGLSGYHAMNSIESLSLNAVEVDHSIPWEDFPARLPGRLHGHCSVVYNGRLFLIGGYDEDKGAQCASITEIPLVPPHTSKQLTTMRQRRCLHGVALFGDKIVIVGGRDDRDPNTSLKAVLLYDITKNECQQLAPLPYPVSDMATVKWGDDSVLIIGGADNDAKPLNTVVIYNVKTQKSHMLPDMKYKRRGCVAAVIKDTVVVIGGLDEMRNYLKSVEYFKFEKYSWEELPEMHEERVWGTAVVC